MGKKWLSILAVLCLPLSLWAGGWNNTLIGCRAIALGGAFTGVADDPSAVFYNPAGLVFQPESFNFSVDGFYIWPTHEYTLPVGTIAKSQYNVSIPQVFFSYRTNDKLTLGFGAYAPYATGGVDWRKDQLGYPMKSYLGVLSLTPTIAYRLSDKLSLGFQVNFYVGVLEVKTEMAPFGPIEEEEKGSSVTAGLGLLIKPTERLSVGLGIRGPATMKLTGTTSIRIDVPEVGTISLQRDSETRFNLPWDVEVGMSYRLSENFLFSASSQYTMWSALDKVDKVIKDMPLVGDVREEEVLDFKNILILRMGLEYILPNGLVLRGGIGLDKAASPDETLSINNIDVDKFTLLGGIGYRVGKMQIDFAFVRALGQEREVQRVRSGFPLSERYNLHVTIVGLGVTFSL